VGDSHADARTLGQAKRVAAIVVNVTVHDFVWTVCGKDTPEVFSVAPWPVRAKARKDSTAESTNFVIVRTWLCSVNHKIHLKTLAVNMAQNV
jgi:hypothetical protein